MEKIVYLFCLGGSINYDSFYWKFDINGFFTLYCESRFRGVNALLWRKRQHQL